MSVWSRPRLLQRLWAGPGPLHPGSQPRTHSRSKSCSLNEQMAGDSSHTGLLPRQDFLLHQHKPVASSLPSFPQPCTEQPSAGGHEGCAETQPLRDVLTVATRRAGSKRVPDSACRVRRDVQEEGASKLNYRI